MFLNILKWINTKFILPLRSDNLSKILLPYLNDSNVILDIGSYNGELAYKIKNLRSDIDIVGVDTVIQPDPLIKIYKYNGLDLKFKDNTFDCVLLIDVLHHVNNQEEVLLEAKRVSKKYILIKDHFYNSKLDFALLKFADYFSNKPFRISLPYNYLNKEAWENLFVKTGLKVVKKDDIKVVPPFDFFNHIIFKLKY